MLDARARRGADLTRYCRVAPDGRSRALRCGGGPAATCSTGGPGCVAPTTETRPRPSTRWSRAVAALGGGRGAARSTRRDHDAAVAAVSHVPQLAASWSRRGSRGSTEPAVALAGQGIRDVTRIAASDPQLVDPDPRRQRPGRARGARRRAWPTSSEVVGRARRADRRPTASAPARAGAGRSPPGNAGQARIPGKHGAAPTAYTTVVVLVPDEPGELARLLARRRRRRRQPRGPAPRARAGPAVRAGRGRPSCPRRRAGLGLALEARGWRLHG